jgi:uncharacterized membrane protein
MRWTIVIRAVFAAALTYLPGIASAQPSLPGRNIGAEVRAVFATKCAVCHGSDVPKPQGRFGYVLDLRRVAANPEILIPGQPTESELWLLVQRDEMPPSDSPRGPLTQEQKGIIRQWIAFGAPDALSNASDSPTAVRSELPTIVSMQVAPADRLIRWLGKFHLVLIHFPIALVFAAGIGEAWSVWQRKLLPSELVRFCLWLGAIAVIPTAELGWLFAAAGNGLASPQLLMAHRWLGTTVAVWLVLTAIYAERDARSQVRSRRVRLLLTVGVLMTALTAHLGGLLARGDDFFNY